MYYKVTVIQTYTVKKQYCKINQHAEIMSELCYINVLYDILMKNTNQYDPILRSAVNTNHPRWFVLCSNYSTQHSLINK